MRPVELQNEAPPSIKNVIIFNMFGSFHSQTVFLGKALACEDIQARSVWSYTLLCVWWHTGTSVFNTDSISSGLKAFLNVVFPHQQRALG